MSKQYYSASSDEGGLNEYSLDALSSVSDWKIWKLAVERHMLNLRERITNLELQENATSPKDRLVSPFKMTFSTAQDDGFCGLWTCARLIRLRKAAFLQCIWLILFIVALGVLGIKELIRVSENTEAQFKPERKMKTIDYYQANDYEMPYIYIYFFIYDERNVNYSSGHTLNDTLEELLQSQNSFENHAHIRYFTNELEYKEELVPLGIEEVNASYVKGWVDENFFFGYFRLKLMSPNISGTYFEFQVCIDMEAMTLNSTVWVEGIWVAVNRDVTFTGWINLVEVSTEDALDSGSNVTATIDYDEKVTRTWTNGDEHLFSTSLEHYDVRWNWREENKDPDNETEEYKESDDGAWEYKDTSYEAEQYKDSNDEAKVNQDIVDESEEYEDNPVCGQVEIKFRSSMMVEHWAEYVDFDIYDWLSWMGGIISISSIFFFWGAYYLAMYFGDTYTMGILPEMSFVFDNFETVHLLKKRAGLR